MASPHKIAEAAEIVCDVIRRALKKIKVLSLIIFEKDFL